MNRATGRIISEPLLQFLLLGSLIWCGVTYWSADRNRYTIEIGPAERQRIAQTYVQQFGRAPTLDQIQRLIDAYIREEISVREGMALHLDRDDEIVRRRIVQKYEFLQTDLAVAATPTPAELEAWYEQHSAAYLNPERVTFTHVYFSIDREGEQTARKRAVTVLRKLLRKPVPRAPELGDSFPGPADVSDLTPQEAGRLFGESEFSQRAFRTPLGTWEGPYRSGYGWHLVYVLERSPPSQPRLSEIRDRVLDDYQDERRRTLTAHAFEKLRAKYVVRSDEREQP